VIAFDTDIVSDIWAGHEPYASRAQAIPLADQAISVTVAEEVLRGRLDQIRKAEAGRGASNLVEAFRRFETAINGSRTLPITDAAHALVLAWKAAKVRVGPRDMRIAASALVAGYTLVTRNARDFSQLPGLVLDVWT